MRCGRGMGGVGFRHDLPGPDVENECYAKP
jgi:hypothetical protein